MPDVSTFAVVAAMAVVTGILFGLSPALHATRGGISNPLRDSSTGASSRSRLQRGFVVAQIALSQPLLVVLGTMLSLVIAEYQPLPPETSRHVISMRFHPLMRTGAPEQRREAVDSLIPRITERPEVLGVVPEAAAYQIRRVVAPDRSVPNAVNDSAPTIVHVEAAAPGWFVLLDVPHRARPRRLARRYGRGRSSRRDRNRPGAVSLGRRESDRTLARVTRRTRP